MAFGYRGPDPLQEPGYKYKTSQASSQSRSFELRRIALVGFPAYAQNTISHTHP